MVRVAVVGAGTLGIKVAGSLAYAGHEVRVHDENNAVLDKVYLRITEDKRILKEDGLLMANNFVGDVFCFGKLEDAVREVDFIFESATEDLVIKKELLMKISTFCKPDAIICTSSMRLSIEEIIENATNKERCLGVRFLYPVFFIPEVEMVPAKTTSVETLEKVRKFLERLGRVGFFRSGDEPIVLNDQQRDARKAAYLRQLSENKSYQNRMFNAPIPDLSPTSVEASSAATFAQMAIKHSTMENDSGSSSREKECVICMDNQRDCVLHPCHHLCTCITCGKLLFKRQDSCPICRRSITNAFRVYHS